MSWFCANGCGREHDHDTVEPELCEVCRAEARVEQCDEWWTQIYRAVTSDLRNERDEALAELEGVNGYKDMLFQEREELETMLVKVQREHNVVCAELVRAQRDGSGDINSAAELEHYASSENAADLMWHCDQCGEPHAVQHDEPTTCRVCVVTRERDEARAEVEQLRPNARYLAEYDTACTVLGIPDDYDTHAQRAQRLIEEVQWDREEVSRLTEELDQARAALDQIQGVEEE